MIDFAQVNSTPPEEVCCLIKRESTVGERPLWHPHKKILYWTDIPEKKLFRYHPGSGVNEELEMPDIVPCFCFCQSGRLLVTFKNQIAFFDEESHQTEVFAQVETNLKDNRFNDGKCDRFGRFWAGTMDSKHPEKPTGHLYRIQDHRQVDCMLDSVVCSNGMDWSLDHRTMYHTQSYSQIIFQYSFDPEAGTLSHPKVFQEIPSYLGVPDGLTVDSEGFIWSCIVGSGLILRFDPKGRLVRKIQAPVPQVTACAFGGPEMKTLFLTSMRQSLDPTQLHRFPLSGSLFAVETGVQGLPAPFFADSSERINH